MFSSGSLRNYEIQTRSNSKKKKNSLLQSDSSNALNDRTNVFFPRFMSASFQSGPYTDVSRVYISSLRSSSSRICILSFDI